MPLPDKRRPLVVILGPTGVGKSELAIRLAEQVGGEIVSADSRLFYRGMDIGTDKPSVTDRQRVPHHLIDVAEPDESLSLAFFTQSAQNAISDIRARGKLPLLVGGTGQYLRAITEGWDIPVQEPDPRLRQALNRWAQEVGNEGLYTRLRYIDPEAAAKIDPRNLRRTVRALEVVFHSGRRFSEQRGRAGSPYQVLQIGLTRPRSELYAIIDARIENMFRRGFVDEVKMLLERGCEPELPSFSAIGYRQVAKHLAGEITLEGAIVQIKRQTRVFVRRQTAWFKPGDSEIHWLRVGDNTADEMEGLVRAFLSGSDM